MREPISLVIVPVDASEAAQAAVRYASLLARLMKRPLQLLHVMPLHPAELSDLPANRQAEGDHDRSRRQQQAAQVFAAARQALDAELPEAPEEVLLEDPAFVRHPDHAILEHARQQGACLVVLGARQLSRVGRFVQGSISHEVVQRAHGPVTLVHAEAGLADAAQLGHVLVPVDGSEHSRRAAALAGELARSAEVPVELLFCRPEAHSADAETPEAGRSATIFQQAREALGEIPCGIEDVVSQGQRIEDAIVARAEHHASASPTLVMGRRGLSKWQSSLMGSVSQRVIDRAPCPVTVVT